MKRCPACGQTKLVSEFYKNRATKDGFAGECKTCRRTYKQVYHRRPDVRIKVHHRHALRIYWLRLWIITILTDGTMLCNVCRKPESNGNSLSCHHRHGDGTAHRMECGGHYAIKYWRSILDSGCNKKLYQALCNSCHIS